LCGLLRQARYHHNLLHWIARRASKATTADAARPVEAASEEPAFTVVALLAAFAVVAAFVVAPAVVAFIVAAFVVVAAVVAAAVVAAALVACASVKRTAARIELRLVICLNSAGSLV
jgi:hypothetical protein